MPCPCCGHRQAAPKAFVFAKGTARVLATEDVVQIGGSEQEITILMMGGRATYWVARTYGAQTVAESLAFIPPSLRARFARLGAAEGAAAPESQAAPEAQAAPEYPELEWAARARRVAGASARAAQRRRNGDDRPLTQQQELAIEGAWAPYAFEGDDAV